jgi:hypothetical protein
MGDNNWLTDLLPLGTILMVVIMQIYFWFPILDDTRVIESEQKKESKKVFEELVRDDALSSSLSVQDNQTAVKTTDSSVAPYSLSQKSESATRPAAASKNRTKTNVDNSSKTVTPKVNSFNSKSIDDDDDEEDLVAMNNNNNNNWRCACEGGFLPPGMLKSFGSAEAMVRLGTGQCYHKQM